VTGAEFYEAVMRSHARLTYGEAADILEGKKKVKRAALRDTLMPLHGVYKAFAGARKVRGALDFELTETVIELDDDGNVAVIRPLTRLVTHRIIEECMIAANVEAAKRIRKSRLPSLYRVHAGPDPKKEEELRLFLQTFDIKLPPKAKLEPLHLSRILHEAKGEPEAELIETVLLRSMSKAVYQVGNIGHFGLGLSEYAHFTSPIRRYPDLLVHRAIKWAISHRSSRGFAYSQHEMTQLGERCSAAERRADKAVWDVEEQLKCRYMQQHVGDEFRVIVASVVPFGLFVRVPELHIDGLIHVSALPPDYYHRDPSGTALVGERSGRRFQLTDRLTARLARVDLEERKIDFAPIEQETQSELPPVKRKRRKRG
jgi:ribonuclease R